MEENLQKNKIVAVYGRVSTSNQEDQKTIEAQLLEVRGFAKKNNYTIVKEYLDEGWSGDILARPELDKLRNDAKNKIWEAVLIYDPDRLGRQLFYQQIVIDELKQQDIDVLFVTMPPIKNPSDELMFGIRGLFAQYEKAKITERFRIGKVNRVTNGHILTTEAPYGYTYIPNKGKRGNVDYVVGHYVINEEEAQIVKSIFSWVADDGLTIRAIVRKLQSLGIQPQRSKRGVWNTSTLSTLLRNKTYIGEAHYGSSYAVVPLNPTKSEIYKKNKKTSRRIRPESEWIKIRVPSLIEEDVFNRANAKLKSNFLLSSRNTKNEYLLAGQIWCTCGQRRAGEGPQRGKHLYYRCTDRVKSFPLAPNCIEKGLNARIVDAMTWQKVAKLMSSPDLLLKQAEYWLNNQSKKGDHLVINIETTEKEITKLKMQEDRYVKAYGSSTITLEQLKEYTIPIREKISLLNNQIVQARLEAEQGDIKEIPKIEEIKLFAEQASKKFSNLKFSEKKAIVRNVIDKVVGKVGELQVYGYIPVTSNINVCTEDRHCRSAKRREVHVV